MAAVSVMSQPFTSRENKFHRVVSSSNRLARAAKPLLNSKPLKELAPIGKLLWYIFKSPPSSAPFVNGTYPCLICRCDSLLHCRNLNQPSCQTRLPSNSESRERFSSTSCVTSSFGLALCFPADDISDRDRPFVRPDKLKESILLGPPILLIQDACHSIWSGHYSVISVPSSVAQRASHGCQHTPRV